MSRRKLVLLIPVGLVLLGFAGVLLLAPSNADLQGEWVTADGGMTLSVRGNEMDTVFTDPTLGKQAGQVYFRPARDGRLVVVYAGWPGVSPPTTVLGRVVWWSPPEQSIARWRYERTGDTLRVCAPDDPRSDHPPAVDAQYGKLTEFIRKR